MTAIEWMFDKLLEEGPSGELRWHLKYDIFKIFEQAKAMEKQQIIDAFYGEAKSTSILDGEQYYNETFKSE